MIEVGLLPALRDRAAGLKSQVDSDMSHFTFLHYFSEGISEQLFIKSIPSPDPLAAHHTQAMDSELNRSLRLIFFS